jgi:hypothetical protein
LAMAVSFLSVAFPHRDSVEAKRAVRAPPEAERTLAGKCTVAGSLCSRNLSSEPTLGLKT